MRMEWRVFGGVLLLGGTIGTMAGQRGILASTKTGPAIVSPSVPRDSRGETVYELQGDSQKDVAVVLGTITQPTLLKAKLPKYPKVYRKEKREGHVVIEVVIAGDGTVLDAKPAEGSDPEFARNAMEAIEQYRFRPGMLDGKPVAFKIKMDVQFRVY